MIKYASATAAVLLFSTAVFAQEESQNRDREQSEEAAQSTATANASTEEEAEDDDRGNEVICRRERATGSLTRINRVCLTRNEWNDYSGNAQRAHADTVRGASGARCFQCD